jgi:hypothetical protein
MKKGRNLFDPFIPFDIAENGNVSAAAVLMALALPHRLGFLDCRLVIPGVTACNFAHPRRNMIGGAPGLFVAASVSGRAASGWELVDLCRPVIQTRIHYRLSSCRDPLVAALGLMLRPTRSRPVTETDIVPALGSCNLIKTKSSAV